MKRSKKLLRTGWILVVLLALGTPLQGALSAQQSNNEDLVPIQVGGPQGKWGYEDRSGKIVIPARFIEAHRFSECLALVKEGGVPVTDSVVKSFVEMGYIDGEGRWVIRSRLRYFFYDDFSEGLVPFRKNGGKWGYMNKKGQVAIPPKFDWAGGFSNGSASVVVGGACAKSDRSGAVTEQSETIQPRNKAIQGRDGTFLSEPSAPPCAASR